MRRAADERVQSLGRDVLDDVLFVVSRVLVVDQPLEDVFFPQ